MIKKTVNKAYNPEIDFWKLIFAVIIFLYHANKFTKGMIPFSRGYIAVEFFFILSGYFMATKIRSNMRKGIYTRTNQFLKGKLLGFYKIFFAAFLIAFVGREILTYDSFTGVIRNFLSSLYEVGLLRMYGLYITKSYNGTTWYISAMMIAMAFLYPLAAKFKRQFFTVASPMLALAGWAALLLKFENLNTADGTVFGSFVFSGVIRALAGLCMGMFINECCELLKEKGYRPTKAGNVFFCVVEFLALGWILIYINFASPKNWSAKYDYAIIPYIALFLFIVLSGLSGIPKLLAGKDFSILSKLSLYLYLNHRIVCYILVDKMPNQPYIKILPIYAGLTILSMILCRIIVMLIDLFNKKCLPRIKNILFLNKQESDLIESISTEGH